MKLTFKYQDRLTGLAAASQGTPDSDIRLDGEDIGAITFNDHAYSDPQKGIRVRMMYCAEQADMEQNPNCKWRWVEFKHVFDSYEAAKAWVRANIERLLPKIYTGSKEKAAA